MKFPYILAIFIVGMLQPIQAGMNAEMRRHVAQPLQAGLVNMLVGMAAVLLVLFALGYGPASWSSMRQAPWWAFCGGLIGGTLVITMLIAAPKLGAALMIACFVVGQFTSSTVIDHFGLVGYAVKPISWPRIAGLLLLAGGTILIQRSS